MSMVRWFGGHVERPGCTRRLPDGAQLLLGRDRALWTAGTWPDTELRVAASGRHRIAVLGPCAASGHDLRRLAGECVPDDVLTMFAGSYTVVESTPAATTVFTDPSHVQPIYLTGTPTGTMWGSSARALAALTGAAPDLTWVAALLMAPDRPRLLDGRSAFTGVVAVPPGSRLTLLAGKPPRLRPAWRPARPDAGIDEGARRLRPALAAAVAVRIDSSRRPSADCSGGLDSTALTLLAAARLGGRARLHAVTAHPADAENGGDLDYARAALAFRRQVAHLPCALDSRHLPYSRMTELIPATDEPAPGTVSIARAVAGFDLLREVDSDCHLAGDGGDTLFGSHPAYLTDIVATGRLDRLARHAIGWARLRRAPVRPLLTDAIRNAAALRYATSPPGSSRPQPAWSTVVARDLVADSISTVDESSPARVEYGTARLIEAIRVVGRTARCDVQIAEHYGSTMHNPFLDPLVVEATLTVPSWLRAEPFRYKPLLATALAGVLPPVIAARRTKGDFTPDHYLGLRANSGALRDLVDGVLAENELVDPERFRRLLAQAEAGLPIAFRELDPVLAAEVWLRAIRASPPAARWADTALPERTRA